MTAVPGIIKRILATTIAVAVVLGAFWAPRDLQGAVVFIVAVGWAMANLVTWSVFSLLILRPVEGKGLLLGALGLIKVVLIAGGIVALKFTAPLTRAQLIGLVTGLSLSLFIAFLMALGARLTGREMSNGSSAPQQGTVESHLGGKC